MVRLTDGDFDALLKRAAEKCMEDDVALYRSVGTDGSVGKLLSCPEKTKKSNIFYSLRKTVKVASLVLVCTLAVTAAVTMSVKAIREKVTSAVVSWFDGYADVEYEAPEEKSPREFIIMMPTYIPDGYELDAEKIDDGSYTCTYTDMNGNSIFYSQFSGMVSTSVDAEDGCTNSLIMLHDNQPAELFRYDDGRVIIIWQSEYHFSLYSYNVPVESMIRLAESIK